MSGPRSRGTKNGVPSASNGFDVNSDENCDGMELGDGEVFFHFVQSPDAPDAGNLTVDFGCGRHGTGPQAAAQNGGAHLRARDVTVTDDGDGSVTVVGASTDVGGGELKISHICAGTETQQSSPPSNPPSTGRSGVECEPETVARPVPLRHDRRSWNVRPG